MNGNGNGNSNPLLKLPPVQRPIKLRHKTYTLREMLALEDDPNRWIIPNMIPKAGKVIVHGSGGSFKSTLFFDIAVAVASGGLLLEQFPIQQHGAVLLISTEGSIFDNRDRIVAHLRARGADINRVFLHYCQEPYMLDEPEDVAELEAKISEIKPILTILDPLDSFFSGDENSAHDTKPLRRVGDRLVREYNTTLCFIHHNRKDSSDYRGSSAWRGWADVMMRVDRKSVSIGPQVPPVPVASVINEKVRNGREGPLFSFAPVIEAEYASISFAYYDGQNPEHIIREYAKQQVYRLLVSASMPMLNSEISDALNIDAAVVSDALEALDQSGLAAKNGAVQRATAANGSRFRTVPAWQAVRKLSLVDAARLMMKLQRRERRESEAAYDVTPLVS